MRKLRARDLFPFLRLVKELGIRDEIKAIAARANTMDEAVDLAALQFGTGLELTLNLAERAGSQGCEQSFYNLLASLWDCSPEEAAELELDDIEIGLREIAANNNSLAFFKSAARAMR